MITLSMTQQCEIPVDPTPSFPFDAIAALACHEPTHMAAPGFKSGRVGLVKQSSDARLRILPGTSPGKTPVKAVAISPDGNHLAFSGASHTVERWDISPFIRRGWYHGHRAGMENRHGTITALAWSPDNTHIASGSSDGSLHIWHAFSLSHLGTFVERETKSLCSCPVTALAWSPDGLLLADGTAGMLRIWNNSGHLQHRIELSPREATITALCWVYDETLSHGVILAVYDTGMIHLCSKTNGACFMVDPGLSARYTIHAISWLAEQQQGQLAYAEERAVHLLLHCHRFSLS